MNRFKARRSTKPAQPHPQARNRKPTPVTPAAILLAVNALQTQQAGKPTLYYILTSKVEDKEQVYQLPDSRAATGFDLAFHPDLLPAITEQMAEHYTLRPLDKPEIRRRNRSAQG